MTDREQQQEEDETPVEGIAVHIDWSSLADAPADHVNQFVAQVGPPTQGGVPDGVYLAFGHISPPLIISTDPEMKAREIEAAKAGLSVQVRGRFHLSRSRLDELIEVLQSAAKNYDDAVKHYQVRASARGDAS